MFISVRRFLLSLTVAGLAACSTPDGSSEFHDPYESVNRHIHAGTVAVDRAVLRPTAVGYGRAVPRPLRQGVVNLADTLDTPRYIVNDLLQGRIDDAGHNIARLILNAFGLGILDVAGSAGLERRPSDFGETLYRWGAPEGAYLSLPLLGPSTQRDGFGSLVDFAMNPASRLLGSDEAQAATATGILAGLNTRYESRSIIEQVLYDSADSYTQTRNIYLQNRRFELSGGAADDFVFDPYEDLQ